jgi:hypothetical protein
VYNVIDVSLSKTALSSSDQSFHFVTGGEKGGSMKMTIDGTNRVWQ